MDNVYIYKCKLMHELLNGKSDYSAFDEEGANYLANILIDLVNQNIGLFCFDVDSYVVLKQIYDEISMKLHNENIIKFSKIFRKLLVVLNDSNVRELYKMDFITSQLKHRGVEIDKFKSGKGIFSSINLFIKEAFKMDNLVIPVIIYKEKSFNFFDTTFLNNTELLEFSLNYFYSTNEKDSKYYQGFIEFYYKYTGISLNGNESNIIDFNRLLEMKY